MFSRKLWVILALLLVGSMVLSACGATPTATPLPATATAVPATATKPPAPPTQAPVPPTAVPAAATAVPATAVPATATKPPATATAVPPTAVPPTATVAATKPITFGVVLVGPYNDHGWSEAHYIAGQYLEKNIPGSKMIYFDNYVPGVTKGTTLDQIVSDMIAKGAKLIFTTSDDFKDETRLAAAKYPNVIFMHMSGDDVLTGKAPKNEGNYMGRMEYGKMIAGCAAAMTTQTGKIGYLGPLINDETRRLAASVFLGAKYCWTTYRGKAAADLKFDVKWIGFWFNLPGVSLDPTKVANDFFAAGTDVLLSGIDTTEALVQASQKAKAGQKVWAVSYDFKSGCAEAPDICLGVPYFNWGPAYVRIVKAVSDGTWKSTFEWQGPDWKDINNPDTSAVGFTYGNALVGDAKAKVDAFIKGLGDGSISLYKGPLKFQDGTVYLKDGETATDQQIWYLPQLLEGMTGPSK
jgi:simple sugar transport system substrate-binding protein